MRVYSSRGSDLGYILCKETEHLCPLSLVIKHGEIHV
jgi:hypothetical protein